MLAFTARVPAPAVRHAGGITLAVCLGAAVCAVGCNEISATPSGAGAGAAGSSFAAAGVGGSAGSPSADGSAGGTIGGSSVGGATFGGGGTAPAGAGSGNGSGGHAGTGGADPGPLLHVFVLTLENHDEVSVIGNTTDAPYLNGLLATAARAANFKDELPLALLSEPHYVWMEAGTNVFADHTFDSDDVPSATNSTADTQHLSTQLDGAGLSWMSYQEGLDQTTGLCPIHDAGYYAPKHDPFIFFRDVSGSPPSATNQRCADHHKPIGSLAGDLGNATASFNFITPDQCHDMHGQSGCPESNTIKAGDQWLSQNLPPLLSYLDQHAGVLFVTWDEGENTLKLPFLALGPTVKHGYVGNVEYTHSSMLKTIERILGVPVLMPVQGVNDLSDLFAVAPF